MVFSPEDGTNGAAVMMMEKMCYHSAKPPAPVHKDPWDASFEHAPSCALYTRPAPAAAD